MDEFLKKGPFTERLKQESREEIIRTASSLIFEAREKLVRNECFRNNLLVAYLTNSINPLFGVQIGTNDNKKWVVNVNNSSENMSIDFRQLNPDLSWNVICRTEVRMNPLLFEWTSFYTGAEITYHAYPQGEGFVGLAAAAKFREILQRIK